MRKVFFAALAASLVIGAAGCSGNSASKVIVGGKAYTEAQLCSEIIAQLIEKKTDLTVERRYGMGSALCFEGTRDGDIDIYPDYTGSMLLAYLKIETAPGTKPEDSYAQAKEGFKTQFNLTVLEPMGFNNTFAIAISEKFAQDHGIVTMSDLAAYAPQMRFGAEFSFYDRLDGYDNMCAAYGLKFAGDPVMLDVALKYQSYGQGQLDAFIIYTTDGLLADYDLRVLTDDKLFFPSYYSCAVVNDNTLAAHPEIATVLAVLDGVGSEEDMVRYNAMVDSGEKTLEQAAAAFIEEFGLLK